jgi:hypothetical protein
MAGTSDRADQLGAAAARIVLNDSINGSEVEEVEVLRLGDHPFQCLSLENIRQVQERPSHGRDRDPVFDGHLVRGQPTAAVQANPGLALAPVPRRHRHVDVSRIALTKVQENRGIPMRQHRTRPAGQHRGQPTPLPHEPIVPDGINTAIKALEPTAPDPVRDPSRRHAELNQLSPGHNPPCRFASWLTPEIRPLHRCGKRENHRNG